MEDGGPKLSYLNSNERMLAMKNEKRTDANEPSAVGPVGPVPLPNPTNTDPTKHMARESVPTDHVPSGSVPMSTTSRDSVSMDNMDTMSIDSLPLASLSHSNPTGLSNFKAKFEFNDADTDAITNPNKKKKGSQLSSLDEALLTFIKDQKSRKELLNGRIVQEKAKEMAEAIGITGFQASKSWLERFKKRNAVDFSSTTKTDQELREEKEQLSQYFNSIIEKYNEKDIFNIAETALFYHSLPSDFRLFKGSKCLKGKFSKDRITVLLCCNMDGSEKIKPLVIGRFGKPRCFKHVKKLPVNYQFNKLSWMTAFLFEQWIVSLDEKFTSEGRKVLFFLDDSSTHPRALRSKLNSINLAFYPSESNYLLQPLELGIISAFKTRYRHEVVLKCLSAIESNFPLPKLNLLHGLRLLNEVWNNRITTKTIKNSFKKAGFNKPCLFSEDLGLDEIENVAFNIMAIESFKAFFAKTSTAPENYDEYIGLDAEVATTGDAFNAFLIPTNGDPALKSEEEGAEGYNNFNYFDHEPSHVPSNQGISENSHVAPYPTQLNSLHEHLTNLTTVPSDRDTYLVTQSQIAGALQVIQQALLQCGDVSNECFEQFLSVKSALKRRYED